MKQLLFWLKLHVGVPPHKPLYQLVGDFVLIASLLIAANILITVLLWSQVLDLIMALIANALPDFHLPTHSSSEDIMARLTGGNFSLAEPLKKQINMGDASVAIIEKTTQSLNDANTRWASCADIHKVLDTCKTANLLGGLVPSETVLAAVKSTLPLSDYFVCVGLPDDHETVSEFVSRKPK